MSKVADNMYQTIDIYNMLSKVKIESMNLVREKITLAFIQETKNIENGLQKEKKDPPKKYGKKRGKQELKVNSNMALLRW